MGHTRNISASGVFFETNLSFEEGSVINFAIELEGTQGNNIILNCRGMVLRVEQHIEKVGVAAKIVSTRVQSALDNTPRTR